MNDTIGRHRAAEAAAPPPYIPRGRRYLNPGDAVRPQEGRRRGR